MKEIIKEADAIQEEELQERARKAAMVGDDKKTTPYPIFNRIRKMQGDMEENQIPP